MASQTNPTLIGAFVLGSIALGTGGVFVFSDIDYFKEELSYVSYFEAAVTGLDIGAPVRFHGVRVGRVSDVHAAYDTESLDIRIPVTITFESGTVRPYGEAAAGAPDDTTEAARAIQIMVDRGLKAELMMDSFVTGKLYVGLDYYPDEEPRYLDEGRSGLPELPTTRSNIDRLVKSLEELPVEELFEEIRGTVASINALVANPKIDDVLTKLSAALDEVGPLSESAQASLGEVRTLAATLNRNVDPTITDLRALMSALQESVTTISNSAELALAEAQEALEPLDRMIGRNYELPYRIQQLLSEMSAATRSVRSLVEYLERHPEALLRGKK